MIENRKGEFMLELRDIKKTYVTGDEKVEALKRINLKFRESEFVSILGQSGCGKTTLLNIIGGLDRYTSGDLIINGKSTKKFKDRDWDAYRNYKVGFVFQSYNLIGHQTVLSNVELALTIGGISKKERKQRAIKALEDVGLKEHIHKKPNQLSGGQMQRVAIARALVNNPDIILADEPTGALDTKTSIQVMEILKKISKDKLIIMVTHNPDLAEKYSSRIIRILDGTITEDSNPITKNIEGKEETERIGRTSMRFWTAFRLSLNNLLTKKGRTILVAFAGSIGIIGIALVQSVSNGFQAYVDHIQEDTLTSYPLTIMQETTDVASALLSMTTQENKSENSEEIKEEQYISKMLDSLSTNDLKSFKKHLEDNYGEVKNDISSIKYSYSIEPSIYAIDATKKIAKLNPSNLFSSTMGSSSMMSSFSSSVFSQMIDDRQTLNNSYDVLAGRWPQKYDEMVIVLSERSTISDLLVYSLGFRDTEELNDIVKKIMSGEKVKIKNDAMTFTYEDLMNKELKLIMPSDTYKYNKKYDIYEDMSEDEKYMKNLYEKAMNLKIVGVVTAKEGVTSMALNPGVAYTSDLVDYIIEESSKTDIVKKQQKNEKIDVLSGKKFDEKKNDLGLDFKDLMEVDTENLKNAFNINIDENAMKRQTENYMKQINNAITTDISPAKKAFSNKLNILADGMFKSIKGEFTLDDVDKKVDNYLKSKEAQKSLKELETKYVIPKDVYQKAYSGLLKGLLQMYIASYMTSNMENIDKSALDNMQDIDQSTLNQMQNMDSASLEQLQKSMSDSKEDLQNMDSAKLQQMQEALKNAQNNNSASAEQKMTDSENNKSRENLKTKIDKNIITKVLKEYTESTAIQKTIDTMGKAMTEAKMKKTILTKVGELTANLTKSFASAFNVDQDKISKSFKMKMTEEEITRVITAMLTETETNAKINLTKFGYQDKEEPTYISFYFRSFDGKEHFKDFINLYNEKVKAEGDEDKEINYTDTTGILMGSVKTIVNAVTYVLIAFISISLVVSSIMIGIITYISVYERTKEIGILRAIGASKHNISSIFNAETFIIGLLSGLFGIGFTYAAVPIINKVLHHFTGNIPLNVVFYFKNAVVLVILSVILTLIGGLIPAKAASKKDPVIALRTE